MPKIRFLKERALRDEHIGTDNETVFAAGQVITVNEASAQHWINRGVAELVTADKPKLKSASKKQPSDDGEINDGDV